MMYYIQILITHPHHLLNLYVQNQQLSIKWGIDNEKMELLSNRIPEKQGTKTLK